MRLKRASIPILSRSAQKIPSIAFSFLFLFLLGTNRTKVVFGRKDCRLARDRMLSEYFTIVSLEQIVTLLGAVSLLSLTEKKTRKKKLELDSCNSRECVRTIGSLFFVPKYPPGSSWCLLVCLLLLSSLPRAIRFCCVFALPVNLPTCVLSSLSISLSVSVDIYLFYHHECVSVSSNSTGFQKNYGALMVKLLNNRTYELT